MQFAAFAFRASDERAPPDIGDDGFPGREAYSNTAGTQRHDSKSFAYNRPLAPVAQWIEQPPPKGQVARSIRVRGATDCTFVQSVALSAKITNGGTLRFPRYPSPTTQRVRLRPVASRAAPGRKRRASCTPRESASPRDRASSRTCRGSR